MNSLWTITYGNYELSVDRRALTYRLTETKTNTVWADGLSLGWMEVRDRATGDVTRHAFGDMGIFSVSEKAGPQGKRILFGLDCAGVPVDIYLIGSEREIQIVVESNRDGKTHTVEGFGLCPGLCAVPDGGSYLVIPNGAGAIVAAKDAPLEPLNLPIWSSQNGVTMPFVGAVRKTETAASLLTLITDSAYGSFTLRRQPDGTAVLDTEYTRDPERRRLDLRILLQSEGNYITVARNYREKIISDRNHVTLRQKMKERPLLNNLVGGVLFRSDHWSTRNSLVQMASQLGELRTPEKSVFLPLFNHWTGHSFQDYIDARTEIEKIGCLLHVVYTNAETLEIPFRESHSRYGGQMVLLLSVLFDPRQANHPNLWQYLEEALRDIADAHALGLLVGSGSDDWGTIVTDFTFATQHLFNRSYLIERLKTACYRVPLLAVVYNDCLVSYYNIGVVNEFGETIQSQLFLDALLKLSVPYFKLNPAMLEEEPNFYFPQISRITSILSPIHALSFSAFLVSHSFLTPNRQVEEALYSNQTWIIINRSETETYETDELALPPLGFYVRHRQMEAFDALRIGEREYGARAWRIARSRDGKPLEQSGDVLRQEFPLR